MPRRSEHVALVTPQVLTWALNESQHSRESIARRLKVTLEEIESWEAGTPPLFKTAQALADHLCIPFGTLFLSKPPIRPLPVTDRRALAPSYRPSPEFRQLLNDVLVRRDFYRQFAIEHKVAPLSFVGSATLNDSVKEVAARIRAQLRVGPAELPRTSRRDKYINKLVERAEEAGVLVMRTSIVGNNTRRHIRPTEVQGFAIADDRAPVVFVNSADFDSARLFTLIHELAHLWLGNSAISNPNDGNAVSTDEIERFCNAVATQFLVPEDDFRSLWGATHHEGRVSTLTLRYLASGRVIARRAKELGLIPHQEFDQLFEEVKSSETQKLGRKQKGGNWPGMASNRVSKRFLDAVIQEVSAARIQIPEAASLLSMKLHTAAQFIESRA